MPAPDASGQTYLSIKMSYLLGALDLDIVAYLRRVAGTAVMWSLCLAMISCADTDRVRAELFETTPVGSSMAQVATYCSKKHLKCNQSDTAVYLNQKTGKTVGKKSMWATISEQRTNPLMVSTTVAYWGFNENSKLQDI